MRKLIKILLALCLTMATFGMAFSCAKPDNNTGGGPKPPSTSFNPVFRMVVASDMHVSNANEQGLSNGARFSQMFSQMYSYADSQAYKKIDAVLLAGDITDYGTDSDFNYAKSLITQGIGQNDTEVLITMGNHDFWGDKSKPAERISAFESVFGPSSSHKVIGGYHFITLCASGYRATDPGWDYTQAEIDYVTAELASAYAQTGSDKPIFVMQHVGNSNTCGGTCEHTSGNAVPTLDNLYKQYPNIVCLSGHSHFACNDECSIHQRDYTSIATGGLYYSTRTTLNGTSVDMENRYEMAQNYVIEIDANSKMRIKCWDVLQQKFVGDTWEIKSYEKEDFIYVEDRFVDGDLFFEDGATVTVEDLTAYSATLTFNPVPQNSLTARVYKIEVKNGNQVVCLRYYGHDYFNESSKPISIEVSGLTPETNYTYSVQAINSLYCSEINQVEPDAVLNRVPVMYSNALTGTFTTTERPPKPADEVFAFTEDIDLNSITANGVALDWIESIHGVTGGVLHGLHSGSLQPRISFDLTSVANNYSDYKWLVIRARFVKQSSSSTNIINDMNICGKNAVYYDSYVYHNAWKNYVYDISSLTETQLQNLTIELTAQTTSQGDFYFDEIYLMKDVSEADLTISTSGTLIEYETVTVSINNPSGATVKSLSIADPKGVLVDDPYSFVPTVAGEYLATITLVDGYYTDSMRNALYFSGSNETKLNFKIIIEKAPTTLAVDFEDEVIDKSGDDIVVTIPTYTVTKNGSPVTANNVNVIVEPKNIVCDPIEITDGKFIAPYDGAVYTLTYEFTVAGKVERFVKDVVLERPVENYAHELISFDYAVDLENFYTDGNSKVTWLQSYGYTQVTQGAENVSLNGVVKVEYTGATSLWFSFNPANLMANYADYDYIIFQMAFENSANKVISVQPAAGGTCEYMGNGDSKSAWTYTEAPKFHAYKFEIKPFIDAWTDVNLDTEVARIKITTAGTGAGAYYISNVYVAKDITNADLNVQINGEELTEQTSLTVGETVAITLNNPELYPFMLMTVKGPDNQEITDLTAVTLATGTYTVTFKHNPIGTSSSDASYYYLRHDYGACYSKGGATKTITFTVA